MKFTKHIFICTNQRPEKQSCGEETGMALIEEFKKIIKQEQLNISVRAQRAGCLDVCSTGPAVVVYPDGIFYGKVQIKDVREIIESHVKQNIPVKRLLLTFNTSQ